MKYFVYARKSTDTEEKQVLSIEAQITELKEFAAKEKLEIVASLCEAKTAKEPGRIIFGEMLKRIEKGEAEGILAWHPDRLARNSIDGGQIIYLLDTGQLKDLKFPTFWFDSTPQGKFMLNIAFGQSKYYVDNLSENVRRGQRQKCRRGEWPTKAPLGYLNNKNDKRRIEVDPIRAPLVKRAFELYSTGDYTLKALAKYLKDAGLRNSKGNVLAKTCVQNMLKKHFYYGTFFYRGEYHEGNYEPIISKSLFDQSQQVMANRGKKKRQRKYQFAFSGLMRCGQCGCMITCEKQKGHHYYHCTKKKGPCDQRYAREELIAEQMKALIQKVALSDDWSNNMLNKLDEEKAQAKSETKVLVQNLADQKAEVEQKLNRLLDLYIEGKAISPEEYQAKKREYLDRKADIQQKVRDFELTGNNWLEPMRKLILSSCQAKILISENNPDKISTFLKNIGSNFILKDKKFQFEGKIGWRPLLKNAPFKGWLGDRDLNPNSRLQRAVSYH